MRLLTVFICLLATVGITKADSIETAARLLKIMDYEGTAIAGGRAVFGPTLKQLRAQGTDEETIRKVEQAADEFMIETFTNGDVMMKVAALYAQKFTEDELNELIAFYDTEVGKKLLAEQGNLMAEGAKIGEEAAQKNLPKFQAKLAKIFEEAEANEETEEE